MSMIQKIPPVPQKEGKPIKIVLILFGMILLFSLALFKSCGGKVSDHINLGDISYGARSEVSSDDTRTVVAVHGEWSEEVFKNAKGDIRMTVTPADAVVLVSTLHGPIPIDDKNIILPKGIEEKVNFIIDPNETNYDKVWVRCELIRKS